MSKFIIYNSLRSIFHEGGYIAQGMSRLHNLYPERYNMAIIKLVQNADGSKQVQEVIREVIHKANTEGEYQEKYQDLAKYIAQAFDYLRTIGVPNPPSLFFTSEDVRNPGRILTFQLLKTLRTPPLLEFRVNWQPEAFRAIFSAMKWVVSKCCSLLGPC